MTKILEDLKYTNSHEWVRLEGDIVTVGITDHAQDLLGDIIFIELPTVGRIVAAEEECAVVESVKAASDVYAPVSGKVVEINEALKTAPEDLNRAVYETWMFKIQITDPKMLDQLLDAAAYRRVTADEGN